MKVLYIYRHPDMGFSIGRVFHPIEQEMRKYCEVKSLYLPMSNYKLISLWKNIHAVLDTLKKEYFDIIHITGTEHYLLPFIKKYTTIVTVHDLGFYTNVPTSMRRVGKYILWIKSLRYAKYVTFISESSQREAAKLVDLLPEKQSVIYNPISNDFQFQSKVFNVQYPRILHIGTKANKNLTNTIKALIGFPCTLRIIGKISDEERRLLIASKIKYSTAFNLSDEGIIKEYLMCDIVNFPSFYEGFGMPIIEGQKVGRVVVTSDLSPMKEIANGSAILVNPYDVQSIRNGYVIAIKEYKEYVKKGLENVKRFSVDVITKEYLKLYTDLIYKK